MVTRSKPKRKAIAKTTSKAKKKAVASKTTVNKIRKLKATDKPFTKAELYEAIAQNAELSKREVVKVFDIFSEIIAMHISKDSPEKFVLPGMLKVTVKKVPAKKARKGNNPFTGEPMMFKAKPASKKVRILPLKSLKDMVQ